MLGEGLDAAEAAFRVGYESRRSLAGSIGAMFAGATATGRDGASRSNLSRRIILTFNVGVRLPSPDWQTPAPRISALLELQPLCGGTHCLHRPPPATPNV